MRKDYAKLLMLSLTLFLIQWCQAQDHQSARLVGGPCEGCEAVFEYGDRTLSPVDTLPDFHQAENKLKVTGMIYQPDGKTPAENVILYIYHANPDGRYAPKEGASGWGRRHGYLRGWIKTGADGKYTFYTQKPGAYGSNLPHIHPIILEPNGRYYWLSSYKFPDDPETARNKKPDADPDDRRGGSGMMVLQKEGDLLVAKRDIILGLNVPGYE